MDLRVRVDGAKALISGLEKLSRDVAGVVTDEIEATLASTQADAIANTPVEFEALRASIMMEMNPADLSGEVYSTSSYAGYQEWGTGGNVDVPNGWEDMALPWKGKGVKQINLKPQPFMYPAFEKNVPDLIRNLKDEIGRRLR